MRGKFFSWVALQAAGGSLTIVASCFWLATFLILPMITISQPVKHEGVDRFQEGRLLESLEWGGRQDQLSRRKRKDAL